MTKWEKMCNDLQVPVDLDYNRVREYALADGVTPGDLDTWFREYRNMLDTAPIIATFTIRLD